MDSTLSSSSFMSSEKIQQDFFIQAEQDGLFFGVEFLELFLSSQADRSTFKITSYFQDGHCIFKGQTGLRVCIKDQIFSKEDLTSLVSYFSGVYTLVSCFIEKQFPFSLMASSTPEFIFSDWEEKTILKAGALVDKTPNKICFSSKDVQSFLAQGDKQITLSNLRMSKEEIKNLLNELPLSVEPSLQGTFFPLDLEEYSSFPLKSVWPDCLQGFFPCLQMKSFSK